MRSTWGSRRVFCPDGCLLDERQGVVRLRAGVVCARCGERIRAGRDTAGVLEGLADGSMKAVVLVGADPIGDFPDIELAKDALSKADLVIAVDCVRSQSVELADVVLTAATHHERAGTTTNIEGRVMRVGQKLTPPSVCWPDWMIAVELAARTGLGPRSADPPTELWDEIERLAPSHSGLNPGGARLSRQRETASSCRSRRLGCRSDAVRLRRA